MIAVLAGGVGVAGALVPGAAGVGDPFFPKAGNGGLRRRPLRARARLPPRTGRLKATARITATATQDLSAFNLDYRGPRVRAVRVDGAAARFDRAGPGAGGHPADRDRRRAPSSRSRSAIAASHDRSSTPTAARGGWIRTDDGAFVVGEPNGSPTWFPCNDHPTDKATYDFRVTVPRGIEAIANGALVDRRRRGRRVTWSYAADQPMASYLATATTGDFRIQRSRFDGIESLVAVDPREARAAKRPLSKIERITRFFGTLFGPYPFGQTGAIVDHAPEVGYALETQTRPIYDSAPSEVTVAHEIAHQWFGDTVSVERWDRDLAQRGVRDLGASGAGPSGRAAGRPRRCCRRLERTPADRLGLWDPPPGSPSDPRAAVRELGLRPRRDGARGAAPARSATTPSTPPCAPGPPSHAYGERDDRGVHRPRRGAVRPASSTRSSSATCTQPGKP